MFSVPLCFYPPSLINTCSHFPFLRLAATPTLFPIPLAFSPSLPPTSHVSPLGPPFSCLYKQLSAGLHHFCVWQLPKRQAHSRTSLASTSITSALRVSVCVFDECAGIVRCTRCVVRGGLHVGGGGAEMASHWGTVGANESHQQTKVNITTKGPADTFQVR